MSSIAKLGLITVLLFCYASCSLDKSDFKPGYSGSFGELIVVVAEPVWNSSVGDSIFKLLSTPQFGLPQQEAPFTIIHVKTKKFASVLKSHRNVLFIDIKKKHSSQDATYVLKKGKWAKGQVVVEFTAPDNTSFLELFTQDVKSILGVFWNAELNRLNLKNKKFGSKTIRKKILETQDINFTPQKGMRIEKNKKDFLWLRLEREMPKGGYQHQISQGIIIAKKKYTSKLQFLDTNIRLTIDSLLKNEIPGPNKEDYMGVADSYIAPRFTESNFKNNFAKRVVGLWEMKGNFFGGPFYAVVLLHPNQKEVVYIYGYVFAPQFSKREYLREVEAMIQSVSFSTSN